MKSPIRSKQACKNKIINYTDLYAYEKKAWDNKHCIYGVDESGRGPLAGPVVVATVMLKPETYHPEIKDSKLLSKSAITKMYHWLVQNCTYNITIGSHRLIDSINIYQATKQCMHQSIISMLSESQNEQSTVLIDAMPLTLKGSIFEKNVEIISMIKGESKSASIAAASIIAKYTRDQIMQKLDQSFPLHQLAKHKGYATKLHRDLLQIKNKSIIHRQTFLKNFDL